MTDATAPAVALCEGRTASAEAMEASLAACRERSGLGAVVHADEDMLRAPPLAFPSPIAGMPA